MQDYAEAFGDLAGEGGAGELPAGAGELEDLGRDLEWSVSTPLVVEQTLHAFLLEGVGDEIEGGSRVAMLHGRPDHRHAIHQVGAEHLVLDLDLVQGEEERVAAEEQLSADGIRVRME
jgi:hypothetical protein